MELRHSTQSSSELDQFALVALQQAAMEVASLGISTHAREELRVAPGLESLATFPSDRDDSFPVLGSSPRALSQRTPGYDEDNFNPRFLESHRELRDLLLNSAQSFAPTRAGSPIYADSAGSGARDRRDGSVLRSIVSTEERVVWLRNYLDEVAPWLDMFDVKQHFQTSVPLLAQRSVPLVYAILAISARQMERAKKRQGDQDSLQLYQESIRSLTPQLLARDPNIMATCVILCVLEMMSASPWNWRKHLEGCAALLSSHSIHGFSGGLLQAVFWCYARMDLCAAIISAGEESVVLPVESWLPSGYQAADASHLFQSCPEPDMWANYAVYLVARVCHFIWLQSKLSSDPSSQIDEEPFSHGWHKLWSELQDWSDNRPPELLPVQIRGQSGSNKTSPFPFLLYAAPCAISSNQLYHTGCLLLLDICPNSIMPSQFGQVGSKLWHARRVCGISMTNEHHGCLNNAVQPLWVAGKLFSHPVEHKAVVELIKSISTKTGWGAKWRIADLKEIWGYERDAEFD